MFLLSVVDSSASTSSNVQFFENVIGTIVSPNYPKEYGNSENRKYVVKAPMRSEIMLIVHDFDVEYQDHCDYDSLQASTLQWEWVLDNFQYYN